MIPATVTLADVRCRGRHRHRQECLCYLGRGRGGPAICCLTNANEGSLDAHKTLC